ncbi:hypothetical protein [Bacillus sp. JCM 19034]|uniref:hypothetical protein n=1 Tax=Bacillus sp. JCM 19034 TaxID=1481928 RepID=UPI00078279E3|nr:hypothetical protein [Bacillus sp. JCM 19034]
MVLGLWELVTDPIGTIKAQVEFIQQVVQEPVILLEIGQMLVDSFMEDVIHGTSYTRGEWMGYAIGLIGLSALEIKEHPSSGQLVVSLTPQGIQMDKTKLQLRQSPQVRQLETFSHS